MDTDVDKDWKKKVGFPINYDSGQSSEDDLDKKDVIMRAGRKSAAGALLDDVGDGAEADMLGTTPPRTRQRYKELQRRRYLLDVDMESQREQLRNPLSEHVVTPERQQRKRAGKFRNRERDWKQEMGQGNKADSLPSSNPRPELPTLVESCNRFMSLTSRLKCREMSGDKASEPEVEERRQQEREEDVPESRVIFHKTFSMLINMGNIEKGCRRAISREEQVWQNELKDLIWLELQAKLAGRTLAQQDAYLCAQRNIVPTLIRNIIDYRFVNSKPCSGCSFVRSKRLCVIEGSREDLTTDHCDSHDSDPAEYNDAHLWGCLSLNCQSNTDSIGRALREVGTLLDSFFNAVALYPSSKAMTLEHPLVATQLFQNRIKAMCLWYNIAIHMRLKVLAVRRMLRSLRTKAAPRDRFRREESELSARSSETGGRDCQVRFECSSNNPTDSSNSESSRSEGNRGEAEGAEGNSDQVDSGSERNCDVSGVPTPEIVISESEQYATTDTSASCESGYHSNYGTAWGADDVYDIGSLEDLTVLQLLGKCDISPYREYHREILKTQGVRRSMKFIHKLRSSLLYKVHLTFETVDLRRNGEESLEEPSVPAEVFDTKEEERGDAPHDQDAKAAEAYELRRYGCWSEESLAMRLPSYRNHFLLLSSICMEAIHDYLTMRLNTRPENPSCLTVKQLIHELKEGLDIATEMREAYVRNIGVALAGHKAGAAVLQELQLVIRTFDNTVETVLKQYLSYLTTMSVTEHMPRSCLESEWSFTARLARRVRCAALLAPNAFTDIACNQLKRIQKQIDDDLEKIEDQVIKNAPSDSEVTISELDRHGIFAICRFTQNVYASEREATLQAAQWARALAARLARAPPPSFQNQRARIFESLMCIRNATVENTEYILRESSGAGESSERSVELGEQVGARVRELLLQVYKLGFELHKVLYEFAQAPFKGLEGGRKPLRPTSLQPPRPRAPPGLRRRRPETMIVNESFNLMIHKELQRVVNESIISRPSTQSSQRRCANMIRAKLVRSESIGEDGEAYDYRLFDQLGNQEQTSIELLLSGERPAAGDKAIDSEGGAPGPTAQEEEWAGQVARAVIGFARCWMKFVMERCDRGRGLRPRWASQGLEFLMLACSPCNTKHLTEQEFEELKQLMDKCISHVIGSRPTARPTEQCLASPTPQRGRPRLQSPMSGHCTNATRDVPLPPTPPTEPDPLLSFHDTDSTAHANRVMEALEQLDKARDQRLREMKALGRVKEETVTSYEPKLRQVTFKWQRGLKIGAGTFGKVYTVVNTETGQLLAMKELSIGVGDRRALQRAANELRVLEGVIHPHLVRYYGCEVHREEMLIFMELCVEGSLEALVATSGALPEHTVRRYTKQLLSAVQELHNRNIAHRDIKSGNIFLTNEGHCLKLGDFGCAVKIRANTTAVGELQGCVGTQAYMAPEVFMKSTGHGRAADIWSLGCVVTEMASGKRPFWEYDNSYQIMFVVGMGGRPAVPDALSPEGADFCTSCLTHDPDLRPRAEALALHHFLLVKSDGEDCNCEPAYFIERKLRDTQF